MSIPGAFLFTLLAIIRISGIIGGEFNLLGLLLFAQSGLAALLMIFRRQPRRESPKWVQAIAWVSALLPMLFDTPLESLWEGYLPIPGLALTLWALVSLGLAFGIAPAYRGLVTTGPYRWLRHPMYAGELLSLSGAFLAAPGAWNLVILLVFAVSILWRIRLEENILNSTGYPAYASAVRWRIVPGVW